MILASARGALRRCMAVGIVAGCVGVAAASADLPPDLARAAREYDRAQIEGDGQALNRLLAPDYVLVNGAAEVETKTQFVSESTAAGFKIDPFTVENPQSTVWTDGAVLAGEVHLTGTSDGKRFAARLRFADVWAKRAGKWQVVFTEVTRFPKVTPASAASGTE